MKIKDPRRAMYSRLTTHLSVANITGGRRALPEQPSDQRNPRHEGDFLIAFHWIVGLVEARLPVLEHPYGHALEVDTAQLLVRP